MIEKIEWHRYHKTHSATANSCDKCFQSLHPWRWKTWIKVPHFSNNSQYPCICKIKSPHSVHEEIHLSITFYITCLKRINNWNKCLVFMQMSGLQASLLVPKSPIHLNLQTPWSHFIPSSHAFLHCGTYEIYALRFLRETCEWCSHALLLPQTTCQPHSYP